MADWWAVGPEACAARRPGLYSPSRAQVPCPGRLRGSWGVGLRRRGVAGVGKVAAANRSSGPAGSRGCVSADRPMGRGESDAASTSARRVPHPPPPPFPRPGTPTPATPAPWPCWEPRLWLHPPHCGEGRGGHRLTCGDRLGGATRPSPSFSLSLCFSLSCTVLCSL